VTPQRRRTIGLIVFVLDVLICPIWAYSAGALMLQALSSTGSGGIGGVSVSGGVVEGLVTVVPPIVTILLARASGPTRLAKHWRNAHLAALLALIILPMMGGLRLIMLSIAVFRPVQVFFVVGALAIWIAALPRPTDPSIETAS
jgi:hypothetical protein